jgi:hypothetical protein
MNNHKLNYSSYGEVVRKNLPHSLGHDFIGCPGKKVRGHTLIARADNYFPGGHNRIDRGNNRLHPQAHRIRREFNRV